ncbi:hypothetical protein P4K44_33365, partial [Bacillus cereus]|nr:hypothetical protein [Bacillus cereus]
AVRLSPQSSENARKLGERSTARKRPIGSTNKKIYDYCCKILMYFIVKAAFRLRKGSFFIWK